jgi:exodeoxyribonuclease VII large subunit
MIERRELELREASGRMRRALEHRIARDSEVLGQTLARVRALSPLKTLERGYAIVQASDGAVVRDAAVVTVGQELGVRLASGRLAVSVTDAADTAAGATPAPEASG